MWTHFIYQLLPSKHFKPRKIRQRHTIAFLFTHTPTKAATTTTENKNRGREKKTTLKQLIWHNPFIFHTILFSFVVIQFQKRNFISICLSTVQWKPQKKKSMAFTMGDWNRWMIMITYVTNRIQYNIRWILFWSAFPKNCCTIQLNGIITFLSRYRVRFIH